MKINQISEKYWKANSKKPKMKKPHAGHESPHPGQSRGFVGEGDVVDMSTPMTAEFMNWLKTKKELVVSDVVNNRVKLRKLRLQYEQETGDKLPEGVLTKHSYDSVKAGGQSSARKRVPQEGDIITIQNDSEGKTYKVLTVSSDRKTFDVVNTKNALEVYKNIKVGDNPFFIEGKSPHKKGTKKYKKHMAAMHAEAKDGNPVAKNMNKFNKPATHKDKKKAMKKGEVKHKGQNIEEANMNFSQFVANAKQTVDMVDIRNKDLMVKAYELFHKLTDAGQKITPEEAVIMAKQHMDNMAYESRLQENTTALSPENRKKFRQIYDPNKEAFGILDFLNWAEDKYPKQSLDWFDDNLYRLQTQYVQGRGDPEQPDLYSDDHAGDVNNLNPEDEPDAPEIKTPDNESLYNQLMKVEAKAKKTRLDPKCWKGYKKQGTKVKGGVRVNNCVPK